MTVRRLLPARPVLPLLLCTCVNLLRTRMNTNNRTVSVIIPVYNRGHLIAEAIQSVLQQDAIDLSLEIIVVDDGSVDNTQEVVAQFGKDVRYIYQDNQGIGTARNRGLEVASGEWLAFLDSDDLWLPDKLSLQFKVLQYFPAFKIIHSNFYSSDGPQVIIEKGLEYWVAATSGIAIDAVDWRTIYANEYSSTDYGITRSGLSFPIYSGNLFKALLTSVCATCWTSVIHKDCLHKGIRFPHLPMVEDYYFYCRLSEEYDVVFLDTPTVEKRFYPWPWGTQSKRSFSLSVSRVLYTDIYLPSASRHKPTEAEIIQKIRANATKLLFEYLKEGDLAAAKVLVREEKAKFGFTTNWKSSVLMVLVALPVNILSRIRQLKRTLNTILTMRRNRPA